MTVWVVVVAAGGGHRFGGLKQFADLGGRPLVDWSVEAARSVADGVVLVVPADIGPAPRHPDAHGADVVVAGGATRAGVRPGRARRRSRRRRA